MTTYTGSCHCGAVAFEIDTVLDKAGTCNCSICRRRNSLMHRVTAENFRLVRGEDALALYQFNTNTARHHFCKHCGIYPFHQPRVAPDAYTVNVYCLDGVTDDDIAKLDIGTFDGKNFSTV